MAKKALSKDRKPAQLGEQTAMRGDGGETPRSPAARFPC